MARYNIKLSLIIPYYELKEYTDELLKALAPQVTPEVEIILIDDGSSIPFETDFEWLKVIWKENGVSLLMNIIWGMQIILIMLLKWQGGN